MQADHQLLYNTHDYCSNTLYVVGCYKLVKMDDHSVQEQLYFKSDEVAIQGRPDTDINGLVNISYIDGIYWLYHHRDMAEDETDNKNELIWYSVYRMPTARSLNLGEKYRDIGGEENDFNMFLLQQGDIIRFGMVRFRLVEFWVEY